MAPLELSQVLAWKPTLRVERAATGVVFLLGERERFALSGAAAEVAVLVDGQRTIEDILRAARGRIAEPEALYALRQLAARGHLVSGAAAQTAFWYGLGLDGEAAVAALRETPVAVAQVGEGATTEMIDALVQAGVRVADAAAVQVVVTDDLLQPALAAINRRALDDGTRWCVVDPTGVQPLIGPMFAPGGPCWDCLAFWIRHNRPVEMLVGASPPRPILAASVRVACGLAALRIARAIAGAVAPGLLAIDLATGLTTTHAVVRRPQCAACGDPAAMIAVGERAIALQPIDSPHREDGGHRRQSPRQTFERFRHLVSPITGAVTHLMAMPDHDTELRAVYASGYRVSPREVTDRNVFDKPCAGKGRSAEQARVSALCEALERFSGVYQGDEARIRASARELGAAALAPGALQLFSEAQYRMRDAHAEPDARRRVPAPLDADTPIDWTPAWSLGARARRYVPLGYCFAEAPADSGVAFAGPCSNGVAAGTCLEEAVLQGLLELVERDAAAVWWYNQLARPAVELDHFADPYIAALRADYARLGWTIWVLDLTHDLGIATCAALAHEPRADRFAIGFGCHLDAHVAVSRALTELNQLFDPAGTRRAPWDHARLTDRAYLFPRADLPHARLPQIHGRDLRAAIEHCSQRLAARGLDVVVVDKTRPDVGLAVAQVIVPGLRHFWPRFAPGRLYDVPVQLGWCARPLAEHELNPVPLFV